MNNLRWKKGSFIFNMTLFLLAMNLSAGVITEIGLFEMRRYDMTQAECVDAVGIDGWVSQRGGNGYCTMDAFVDNQYQSELDGVVKGAVCENYDKDNIPVDADGLPEACDPRTYEDQGVPIPGADTILKTLGDVAAAMTSTASIFSAAIVSPLGWLTTTWQQCASSSVDVNNVQCTEQERSEAEAWTQLINYMQIPIYIMYCLFIIQIIMNRSFRGVT